LAHSSTSVKQIVRTSSAETAAKLLIQKTRSRLGPSAARTSRATQATGGSSPSGRAVYKALSPAGTPVGRALAVHSGDIGTPAADTFVRVTCWVRVTSDP